eukprot:699283-Pyramimonas_sp.AAC.1
MFDETSRTRMFTGIAYMLHGTVGALIKEAQEALDPGGGIHGQALIGVPPASRPWIRYPRITYPMPSPYGLADSL